MTAGRGFAAAPISAVIITRDAARRLPEVLMAVDFCAERLVLDSGSVDDTVAVAHAAGARVEHQDFLGYGPQKRRAVELATHDWILSIDADEVLDEEARRAVRYADLSDPSASYAFRRRTFVGDREVRHGAWGDDRVLRLFNRRTASFKPLPVHEEVAASRPPVLLPGSILHYSYTSCSDVLDRSLRYAPLKAAIMRHKGQRINPLTMPLRGLAAFVKSYVVRGGWRDGAVGFVVALARIIDSTLPRAMLLAGDPLPEPPLPEPPLGPATLGPGSGTATATRPPGIQPVARSDASSPDMSAGTGAESVSRSPDAG